MKIYSIEELNKEFKKLNYKWFDFHIVGIRSKSNEPNKFDDLIGIVKGDTITWFTCTTNPGTFWLENPSNKLGTALLVPGQYIDTYGFGLHQGKYRALKQYKEVSVYRDNDKDKVAEVTNTIDKGLFGINIHHAGKASVNIDKWSAGCQVVSNLADWALFLKMCEDSKLKSFTYTLLNEF